MKYRKRVELKKTQSNKRKNRISKKKVRLRKTLKDMETKIYIETKKTDNHQNYNKKNNKKGEKKKKRKIRKSKKVENTLKNFKVFYQNVLYA